MDPIGFGVLAALAAAVGGASFMRFRAQRKLTSNMEDHHRLLSDQCPDDGWQVTEAFDLVYLAQAERVVALAGEPGDAIGTEQIKGLVKSDPELGPWVLGSILARRTAHGLEIATVAWREAQFKPISYVGLPTDGRFEDTTIDFPSKAGDAGELDKKIIQAVGDNTDISRLRLAGKSILVCYRGYLTPNKLKSMHAMAETVDQLLDRQARRL